MSAQFCRRLGRMAGPVACFAIQACGGVVQGDGNVVVYGGPGPFDAPLWASNTCCR